MKNLIKRCAPVILAFIMILSVTACAGNNQTAGSSTASSTAQADNNTTDATPAAGAEGTEPAYAKFAGDPTKLQWYIHFSWFPRPDTANAVHQKILETTGVDIEFVIPAGNESEKLNSMIASDTLPDLITLGWWEGTINELIDAGMVYALNELADQHDPYFWTVADEGRVGWYTSPDGNLYQYPNASYSPDDYQKNNNIASNLTFLVRKDMYEGIGSPDMTTPEGFNQAIRDAAKAYPTVKGQPLIPLGAQEFREEGNISFNADLQDFLAIPREDANGNAYDRESDPEYIKWLKVFRQLGSEGLLADDIFIDQRAQMEEKIAQGRYFAMMYQRTDMATQQKALYAEDPNSIYMAVDGPKNANGDPHKLSGVGISGWTVTMITQNCKTPERAIALMSYLMSRDGQMLTSFGPEGIGYDLVDGMPVEKPEVKELKKDNIEEYNRTINGNSNYWMLMDNAMMLAWAEPPEPPLDQMEIWTYPYVVSPSQYSYNLSIDSEESTIDLKVKNLFGSTLPKLLTAPSDEEFDRLYNDYMTKKAEYGYDKVLAEQSKQLAANKAKLGIE